VRLVQGAGFHRVRIAATQWQGRHRGQGRRHAGQASLDADLLDRLRHSYNQAVAFGISVSLSRPWHNGNHPGLVLADRLKRKAAQVWLFATRFDVPATNNGSEDAIRGYKLAAKVSGYWCTLETLQRHCRIPGLPHHCPQPRLRPPRRHPRWPQRQLLYATPPSMINQPGTRDWLHQCYRE
jgi:hypothetical protein